MSVVVDTPIWSSAFRRKKGVVNADTAELRQLIVTRQAHIIGPIRQETLSGIRDESACRRLCEVLRPFPDIPLLMRDYEMAAAFFNQCRAKGVQGSITDYLICAVAVRLEMKILTTDKDFALYALHLPVLLYERQR